MKQCELCRNAAKMFCEADQASLCWGCDEKVHCANFLVARHSRNLLCHVCHSQTPWKASGPKLTPTISVCESCVKRKSGSACRGEDENVAENEDVDENEGDGGDNDDDEDFSFSEYEDDYEDENEDKDKDEEGENQVVPLSSSYSDPLPRPRSSSGSEADEELSTAFSSLKRVRENVDLDSDDEIGCATSIFASRASANDEASSSESIRAIKRRRVNDANQPKRALEESRSTAIVSSLRRLQNDEVGDGNDAAATVLRISKLTGDHSR